MTRGGGTGSGRVRARRGELCVRDGRLEFRSTVGLLLAGRWGHLRRERRAAAAWAVAGVAALVLSTSWTAWRALDPVAAGAPVDVPAAALLVIHAAVLAHAVRRERVPLRAVEAVEVDDDEGSLAVTHEPDGPLARFRSDARTRRFSLRTAEDVAEARALLRRRGVDVEEARGTATAYRFSSRGGVTFCDRCDSQVSPADASCPACGFELRVERAVTP